MYSFRVIQSGDAEWDTIIKSSYLYDFYHTSFYHNIDNNYKSFLFYAGDKNDFIALPLVLRPIEDSPWFDFTSVYGYCGPVLSKSVEELPDDLISFFEHQFNLHCKENDIVSAFSRLHPFINQKPILQNLGDVLDLNKTVSIDLTLPPEIQRRHYNSSCKYEINRLIRNNFIVTSAESENEIDAFVSIYYETMDRVQASKHYYFSKDYFYTFLRNNSFGSKLLLAKFEEEIVAGAIFTYTDKIMQYHLAGTSKKYMALTPMKLLIDSARHIGNEMGLQYLHLGGGVGGSDEDSLFRFKAGFSDFYYQFSVWRYITDQEKYDHLVSKKTEQLSDSSFFPLYRI